MVSVMTNQASSWTGWIAGGLAGVARVANSTSAAVAAAAGAGGDYSFPSDDGLIAVREESRLPYLNGTMTRARCTAGTGRQFDLRRLRLAPGEGGGFVTLEDVEHINLQADIAKKLGRHPNVQRCLSSIVENERGVHCKIFLCEPCLRDLQTELAATPDGTFPLDEALDTGQQLSLGLGHLHSSSILYGGLRAEGVLRGLDGHWKLADFSFSERLPVSLEDWRWRHPGGLFQGVSGTPPELRAASPDKEVELSVDVWLLGLLLASLVLKRSGGQELVASPAILEDATLARLWMLLHWPLAEMPVDRPFPNELSSLLNSVKQMSNEELLHDMPRRLMKSCQREVMHTARQLALEQAAQEAVTEADHARCMDPSQTLAELHGILRDGSRVERMCANCGLRPWENPDDDDDDRPDDADAQPVAGDVATSGASDSAAAIRRAQPQESNDNSILQYCSNADVDDDEDEAAVRVADFVPEPPQLVPPEPKLPKPHDGAGPGVVFGGNPFDMDSPFVQETPGVESAAPAPAPEKLPDLIDVGLPDLIDL